MGGGKRGDERPDVALRIVEPSLGGAEVAEIVAEGLQGEGWVALDLLARPGTGAVSEVRDLAGVPFEPIAITRAPRTRAFVKIEDGCNCRCAYCAIPLARGPVRPRDGARPSRTCWRQTTPWATMASATFTKPAMFAPIT